MKKKGPGIKHWQCHVESGSFVMRDAGIWESVKTEKSFTLTQVEADYSQKDTAMVKRIHIRLGVQKVKKYDFFGKIYFEERATTLEDFLHFFPEVISGELVLKYGYRFVPNSNATPYYFYPLD